MAHFNRHLAYMLPVERSRGTSTGRAADWSCVSPPIWLVGTYLRCCGRRPPRDLVPSFSSTLGPRRDTNSWPPWPFRCSFDQQSKYLDPIVFQLLLPLPLLVSTASSSSCARWLDCLLLSCSTFTSLRFIRRAFRDTSTFPNGGWGPRGGGGGEGGPW